MKSFKTVWISDIHLGSKGCAEDELLLFLNNITCDNMFLVGDIIDLWKLKRKFHWSNNCNEIIRSILKKSKSGCDIKYILGNHDEYFRSYIPLIIGDIEILNEYEYHSNGKIYLITHGDLYDTIVRYHKWIAKIGDIGYEALLRANKYFNFLRYKVGMKYWSLSKYIKQNVKHAAAFISEYEHTLAVECRQRNCDGIISGHIHHAEIKRIGDILYLNDGDWVESKTALVEHHDGNFSMLMVDKNKIFETIFYDTLNDKITVHPHPVLLKVIL